MIQRKRRETYSRGKDRDLASMEVRAVSARDWACFWQTTSHHSQAVVAIGGGIVSHRLSPFAVGTDPSGAEKTFREESPLIRRFVRSLGS